MSFIKSLVFRFNLLVINGGTRSSLEGLKVKGVDRLLICYGKRVLTKLLTFVITQIICRVMFSRESLERKEGQKEGRREGKVN